MTGIRERAMTTAELVEAIARRIGAIEDSTPAIAMIDEHVAGIVGRMREKCRAAIAAESAYSIALHAKTGSRYGADRYARNLKAAGERRDALAKELGL